MAKILFSATAGLYIQFFNFIKENEINLYHLKLSPLGFTAICDADDYFFIAKSSRKFQTKVRIENKKGLYFRIRKLLTRKGIFTAVILFFVMNIVYSNLIWDIDIHTDDATIKNEIVCQLYKQGIYPGSVYNKNLLHNAVEYIMLENQHLGYITLNFYKGILDCNVYKKTVKEDYISDLGPDNIYASKSGIITDIRVYDGFSQVQLGQSVFQGDVLVSNLYTDRHGNSYTGKTRAYIEAECDCTYTVFVPYEKCIRLLTGKSEINKTVLFAGKEFILLQADTTGWYDSVKTEKIEYFSFMGFRFPLTVKTDTYYQTRLLTVTKELSTALSYGKLQLHHIIENDIKLKKEYTRKFTYKTCDDGLRVICDISGIYEIT